MSSSDEEFVWTNTSKDDSESEVEMPYDGESESGKSYKKKLQKQLFQNGELDSSAEAPEPRRKKKKHKREISSPAPDPREGLDDSAAAEHMLRVKVKEERVSFVVPRDSPRKRRASSAEPDHEPDHPPRKKKKKREKEEPESSPPEAVDGPESPRKRKKRKRDSERSSGSDRGPVIDKFEAEETVVEHRPKVNGHVHREEPEPRPGGYPSKEFVEDDDSSGDERPAPPPPAPGPGEPRKPRVSDRITFESQSESEPDRAPKPVEKSRGSVERARNAPASRAEVAPSGRKSAEVNGKRPSVSERITFEESQAETEVPEPARRISERITFEESPSDSEPERAGAGPTASARLERFGRARPELRAAGGALAAGAGVGADDDVWLVRAPADLPAAALRGVTLAVDARGKLTAGGRALEAAPAPAPGRVALLAPGAGGRGLRVRALAPRGALRLRARLPRPRAAAAAAAAAADDERVSPPPARARHPLLGAQWERAAELAPAVRRRLRAARGPAPDAPDAPDDEGAVPSEPREKKKKKKKHRERPEPEPDPEPEPEPAEKPRKRKRKHGSRSEVAAPEPASPEPASPPPRKKSKKEKAAAGLRRDDPAVWDSERAIEESLFDF